MRIFIGVIGVLVGGAIGLAFGMAVGDLADTSENTGGRYGLIASIFPWIAPISGLGMGGLFGFVLANMPFQGKDDEIATNEFLSSIKHNPEEKMRLKLKLLEMNAAENALGAQSQEELGVLRRFFELEPEMRKIVSIAHLEIRNAVGDASKEDNDTLKQWLEVYEGTRETIEVRMTLMLRDYKERDIASEKELRLLDQLEAKFADR